MTAADRFKRLDLFFRTPKGLVALCVGLFGVVAWTFLPALQGSFLANDDYAYVQSNPHVNSGLHWQNFLWALGSFEQDNWHPMTWLSHMLDVQLYGLNPWGHHLTSVLLHALNTVLVFLVFRKMTGAVWRSFFVAGLFGLHPLRVESVAWISERKDVLSAFFGLLALMFYVRYAHATIRNPKFAIRNYLVALLFFALGLMSKTMLVTLPFVFLLLDYWPLQRVAGDKWQVTRIRQLVLEKVPFFALSAVVSTITYIAQARGGAMQEMIQLPLTDRFVNALLSYAGYLGKFFWPENLCCYYPHPVQVPAAVLLPAGALVAGLSLWAWLRRRQSPYLLAGWFWYVGTLVPVIGLVQLGSEAMADRYSYIPLIGINLLLVWGWSDWVRRWRYGAAVLSTLATVALAACVLLTRHQINYWKDDITVWSRAVAVTKNNYVAHDNLGAIIGSSDPNLALYHFQEAVRLNPRYAHAQEDLAFLLSLQGRAGEAVVPALKAAELDPKGTYSGYLLPGVLFSDKRQNESSSNFLEAVQREPRDFDSYLDVLLLETNRVDFMNKLAWVFATYPDRKLRDGPFALRLAKRACEISRYQVAVYDRTLAAACAETSRFDEAVAPMLKAVELDPKAPNVENELEMTLFNNGRQAETVSNFLAAVRLEPRAFGNYLDVLLLETNRAEFMNNLAWIFATYPDPKLCNGEFAVRLAKRACEITGDQVTIYVGTLAAAYAENSQFDEAVSAAQRACSLASAAGQPDLLKTSQGLLTLFRSHQSYHQPVQNNSQ